jgi:hypothetical protein
MLLPHVVAEEEEVEVVVEEVGLEAEAVEV